LGHILQPSTEPVGPGAIAENNTYWVRDLRFSAIIVLVLGLILAFRGHGARSGLSIAAGAGWLVADLALDRADVAGGEAAALLAVAGCAVVVTLSLLPGRGAGRRDRRVLIGAASVGAARLSPPPSSRPPTPSRRSPRRRWRWVPCCLP
jgi:hypothetical protein